MSLRPRSLALYATGRTERIRLVAPLVVLLGMASFRLLTPWFPNDHVSFLSRARQILYGDLPIRDFFDPGFFLALHVSAAVDWLAGHRLVGEAMLTSTSLAVGYALVVVVARRVSGSTPVAVAVALVAASLLPRLMNHHKVLVPAAGLYLAACYVRRGSLARAVGMGAFVGIATLYRHDHGVYLVPGLLVVLAIHHRRDGLRVMARHAVAFAVALLFVLAPFALFVARNGGIGPYLAVSGGFVLDSQTVPSLARLPAIVVDGGVVRAENAAPVLYYLIMGLVIAGAVLAVPRALRATPPADAVVIVCAALFGLLSALFFLRNDLTYYGLGDAAVAPAVIGAWILGGLIRSRTARDVPASANREAMLPGFWPVFRGAAAAACILVVWALVASAAPLGAAVHESGLSAGPQRVAERVSATARYLLAPPLDAWTAPGDRTSRALVRYVHECTRPTDRVLSTGFSPEYHYFADRAFAGARIFWPGRYFGVEGAQARTIATLDQESVPIVIVDPARWTRFAGDYPAIASYLDDRYLVVRDVQFPDGVVRVLVDRGATATHTYEALDLPCFA